MSRKQVVLGGKTNTIVRRIVADKAPPCKNCNFTGDTGGTLDWQIGFEDPPYYGLFGSKKKKEADARQDAINDARAQFPGPRSCADCLSGIQGLRAAMVGTQELIDNGSSPNVAPRYLDAYNTILSEYQSYYNRSCLSPTTGAGTASNTQIGVGNQTGPAINNDPIISNGNLGGNITTQPGGTTTTPGQTTSGTTTTTDPDKKPAGTSGGLSAGGFMSKVPKWAIYGGAGLMVTAVVLIVVLKSKK